MSIKKEAKQFAVIAVSMVAVILLAFFAVSQIPVSKEPGGTSHEFDTQSWKKNQGYYRERCVYNLMDRHLLDGKTHKEVESILGPSDPPVKEEHWGYDIPPSVASFSTFVIYFKDGKVKSYELRSNP